MPPMPRQNCRAIFTPASDTASPPCCRRRIFFSVLKAQASRLMASPRLETGMRTFFSDYLELDTLNTITKDPTIYPKYSEEVGASAREETLRTTIDLVVRKNGDFRDLFTTRKTFINRPLAWIYSVPYN